MNGNENKSISKLEQILRKERIILDDLKANWEQNSELSEFPELYLNRSQSLYNKKDELDNETINQLNKNLEAERELKQHLSWATFIFMCVYICAILGIVWAKNHCNVTLTPLIYTIPAPMALFGWILKGLFPKTIGNNKRPTKKN